MAEANDDLVLTTEEAACEQSQQTETMVYEDLPQQQQHTECSSDALRSASHPSDGELSVSYGSDTYDNVSHEDVYPGDDCTAYLHPSPKAYNYVYYKTVSARLLVKSQEDLLHNLRMLKDGLDDADYAIANIKGDYYAQQSERGVSSLLFD